MQIENVCSGMAPDFRLDIKCQKFDRLTIYRITIYIKEAPLRLG
jgi:hypothetical protein